MAPRAAMRSPARSSTRSRLSRPTARSVRAAVLTNLGVTSDALGNRNRALTYYQQAYALSEALGDNQGAAYSQANAASLLIRYINPEEGFRNIQNALAVVRKLEDKNFEVFC